MAQVAQRIKPRLTNPALAGSGAVDVVHGVVIEQPNGWQISQPNAKDKDTTLAVYHRSPGIGIDGGSKTGSVILYQSLTLPAGEFGLQIDLLSHAVPDGPYDAKLQVAILADDERFISDGFWVDEAKTTRTLHGVVSCTKRQMVTVQVIYTVRYASVSGEMQVKRVQFTHAPSGKPDFNLRINTGSSEGSRVSIDGYIDMWRYMIPAARHEHELTTPHGSEFIRRGEMADNEAFVNKNQYWEHKLLRDGYVCHGADCSAAGGSQVYVPSVDDYYDRGGTYGQPWFPRYWSPGGTYSTRAYVVTYTHSGVELSRTVADNHYRFEALHETYSFPSGKTLPDVAEVHWRVGDANKSKPDEVYLLAQGMGYVGHWNQHGYASHYKQDVVQGFAVAYGFTKQVSLPWLELPTASENITPPSGGDTTPTLTDEQRESIMQALNEINVAQARIRALLEQADV